MDYSPKITHSTRRTFFLVIVILLIPFFSFSQMLKAITYNIRYDNPNDGESAWQNRKESMVDFLKEEAADLIGLQEVLKNQFDYLGLGLSKYGIVGVGREDGRDKGEFSPVLYKKGRLKLVASKTVWLSETPNKPSIGWDAALERIATICLFELIGGSKQLLVVNTHYDHKGEAARLNSSKLILSEIRNNYSGIPLILMGDFNSEPDTETVKVFNDVFRDSFECIERGVPGITFAGFTNTNYTSGSRIDYIFTEKLNCISSIIKTPTIKQRNLSDHLPVIATLEFQN